MNSDTASSKDFSYNSLPYQERVMHGPYVIEDEAAFIANSPRKSRMPGIAAMDGETRQIALQNHAALLAALSAYDSGLISHDAYQQLRVHATKRHDVLSRSVGVDPRIVAITI